MAIVTNDKTPRPGTNQSTSKSRDMLLNPGNASEVKDPPKKGRKGRRQAGSNSRLAGELRWGEKWGESGV
ncbi:hypothetical protein N7457_006327 [Penicillium paradoxum]|uniref:uncharacterized protein n=1 Tax=Penicillium paradoxum TaxID=176176 RepID=UPI002549326C|nr:uncharacterized protein N7457_006327 [Penicillium paradoxum]KAJ5781167.1 hypothetical protein N7457_006327 [Penicillium paradoxum]